VSRNRILTNATFVTDDGRASTAVVVGDERILAVGALEDVQGTVGGDPEIVDLDGGVVFPGFADNHLHVLNFGRSRLGVPCWPSDVSSVPDIVDLVQAAHRREPKGKWIRGRGYDPSELAEHRAPTATEIDLDDGRCVVLDSFDFHRRVANHAALAAAGIGADTADPPEGEIVRDQHGEPTGELVDGARALIDKAMPPWTKEEDEHAIEKASDHFLSLGFTYLTNAAPLTMSHTGEEVAAFLRLSDRGLLRLRFTSMVRAQVLEAAHELGIRPGIGNDYFQLGGAKVFADGAFGTRTAFLSAPYSDSETRGSMRVEPDELESVLRHGSSIGWQMCVHAIGDGAIGIVALLMEEHPPSEGSLQHRIEHCSLTSTETIDVMAKAGIVPVPQLGFLRYRAADFLAALGPERVARLYPLRSWIDAGLRPIHSSDAPVIADARPMAAIATATSRADATGRVWGPEEAITFDEAIAMMTVWSAEASGCAKDRGRIAPGYLADFTVFRTDPRSLSPDELPEQTPSHTIVGGDIAWRAR
jgi:predicted amidohydrolase YtcJ